MHRAPFAPYVMFWLSLLVVCVGIAGTSFVAMAAPNAQTGATTTAQSTTAMTNTVPAIMTPLPMRAEEPLTGASSSVPAVFAGLTTYLPLQATLVSAGADEWNAAAITDAARAVVQIRRCDSFGCTTPVGRSRRACPSRYHSWAVTIRRPKTDSSM